MASVLTFTSLTATQNFKFSKPLRDSTVTFASSDTRAEISAVLFYRMLAIWSQPPSNPPVSKTPNFRRTKSALWSSLERSYGNNVVPVPRTFSSAHKFVPTPAFDKLVSIINPPFENPNLFLPGVRLTLYCRYIVSYVFIVCTFLNRFLFQRIRLFIIPSQQCFYESNFCRYCVIFIRGKKCLFMLAEREVHWAAFFSGWDQRRLIT